MSTVKKQHYVPQFYLRHFSKTGERLQVYDKFQQKVFGSHIRDIASSNYFYDLPLGAIENLEKIARRMQAEENTDPAFFDAVLKQIKDIQMIEKYLSKLEYRFERVLKNILDSLEHRKRFKQEYRIELSQMAAMQFVRTQNHREMMIELSKKIENDVMPLVHKINEANGVKETTEDLGIEFDLEKTELNHKKLILDRKFLDMVTQIFNHHIWVIGVNETSLPLYTSDNPIALQAHKNDDHFSNTGIASPGIEIVFPLTPKYILIMYERTYFQYTEYRDGHLSYLDEENVLYYNSMQVISSYRQLYSNTNNFELVETMLNENPELKAPLSRLI